MSHPEPDEEAALAALEAQAQAAHRTHAIKVRERGKLVYRFLTPNGGETRLRIHAGVLTEAAARAHLLTLAADNPGYEFKVVPLFKKAKPT